jgi:signal transduction histidine kinase
VTSEGPERDFRQEDLAFFGRIGADVSHELRNVLSIVGEHAGLLDDLLAMATRRKPLDAERVNKIAASIVRQVHKGTGILDRFSTFAHAAVEPSALFDLTALTENLASLALRRVTLAGGKLDTNLPQEPILIRGNPFQVQHALFTAVALILESVESGTTITINLVAQASQAEITVTRQTGDDDELPDRLDPLTTLVGNLGGSVEASSTDGTATLTMTIPAE